jgi:hypothetical protein
MLRPSVKITMEAWRQACESTEGVVASGVNEKSTSKPAHEVQIDSPTKYTAPGLSPSRRRSVGTIAEPTTAPRKVTA